MSVRSFPSPLSVASFASFTVRACRALALALPLALAACSGGGAGADDGGGPPVTQPPPPAAGPTAAFTAAASATAMQPLVFDATASASADGSALAYRWDFGDGGHGGGRRLAHVYATAGTQTVTLTVVDAAGRSATARHTVTVAAQPAATGSATVHVVVRDLDGAAVAGATVALAGTATRAVTDASGRADLVVGTGTAHVFTVRKEGYSDQVVAQALPSGTGDDGLLEATLRPRDAAVTLADAHAGGTVVGRAGATLTLPPDALVDAGGAPVTGPVQVAMTAVDVTAPRGGGFPGRFDGVRADASTTPIASLGTVEFALAAGGRAVQLAAGRHATVEIPITASVRLDGSSVAVGERIDLWSLDEASALWIQEGTGTVVASGASPTGLALRAQVGHLSWWNADLGFEPYGPRPRCIYDDDIGIPEARDAFANATVCNFLAQFDRAASAGKATPPAGKRPTVRAATAVPPRILGYARSGVVPIAGGTTVPVPANWDIAISALALNGTWAGSTVVNGPVGAQAEVLIRMRPLPGNGPGTEAITLPFDTTRQIAPAQVARYAFAGAPDGFVRVTLTPVPGSAIRGQLRVVQGTTLIATRHIAAPAATTFTTAVGNAAATYRIEVESTAAAAAAYRLQAERVGGGTAESLALPLDVQRTLPAFTVHRATFDATAGSAVSLVGQASSGSGTVDLQLLAPDASVVATYTARGSDFTPRPQVALLPASGRYTLAATHTASGTVGFRATVDATPWAPVGPGLDVSGPFAVLDLKADRQGNPVLGYVRTGSNGDGSAQMTLRLRRWTGGAWEAVGSDVVLATPCDLSTRPGSFAFDAQNVPYLAYATRIARGSDATQTVVRRHVGGAWEGVGPADGALPGESAAASCETPPRIALDAADRPVVAYRTVPAVRVVRLGAGSWQDLGPGTGFAAASATAPFDLALDRAGTPHLLLALDGLPRVRRHDGTAWQPVGANDGALPMGATVRVTGPRLQVGADGRIAVAALVAVGNGPAAWRFDGTAWSGPQVASPVNGTVTSTFEPGLAVAADGSLLASWWNQSSTVATLVVQRLSTAGTWQPVGLDPGPLVPYAPHGLTPDARPLDSRLLSNAQGDWLVVVVRADPGAAGGFAYQAVLLRRVGG